MSITYHSEHPKTLSLPKKQTYPKIKTSAWDTFRLLAKYWLKQPITFGSCLFIIVLMSIADLVLPIAAGKMVDEIVSVTSGDQESVKAAMFALWIFVIGKLSSDLLRFLHSRVWNPFAAKNMQSLLDETFEKVQRFSSDWHANSFAGATVRKVTRAKWAYDAMSDIFWIHFLGLALLVSGFTIVIAIQFPLVGALFFSTIIIYIALSVWLAIKYVRPANVESAKADSAIGAAIADSITNNAAVKAFGAEKREETLFGRVSSTWSVKAIKSWNRGQDLVAIQRSVWTVLQFSTILVLIQMALNGQATAGDVALLLTANLQLGGSIRQVGDNIRQLQRASSEFADVVDIHKRDVQVADKNNAVELKAQSGEIKFKDVSFAYEQGCEKIYEDFSLTIHPGEKVGLVGHSGAGKSTFVKLIQRLYDLDQGQILIDGQPITEVTQRSLRKALALVPQDPLLFHRSLADNIAYAKSDAKMDEIRLAAKKARASDFIERLAAGYDTLVGERGVKLSGGERQRVAIARAFLADAPIVIFDEATSSLDTITEKHIQDAMEALMEGRTTIIIAHRLSTIRDMDRILVFDDGRVVEQGHHEELMEIEGGVYRALYEMQSSETLR